LTPGQVGVESLDLSPRGVGFVFEIGSKIDHFENVDFNNTRKKTVTGETLQGKPCLWWKLDGKMRKEWRLGKHREGRAWPWEQDGRTGHHGAGHGQSGVRSTSCHLAFVRSNPNVLSPPKEKWTTAKEINQNEHFISTEMG